MTMTKHKLSEFLKEYQGVAATAETMAPVIRVRNLSKDDMMHWMTASDFPEGRVEPGFMEISGDAILLSRAGSLRPTMFESWRGPAYMHPSVCAFIIEDGLDPDYLTMELNKDYVRRQVEPLITEGHPLMTSADMLNLQIDVPEGGTKVQQDMAREYLNGLLRQKSEEQRREIQNVKSDSLEEYVNLIRMRKHDIRPYLRELRSAGNLMRHFVKNRAGMEDFDIEMTNCLNALDTARENISAMLDHLSDELTFGEPELLNIDKFLTDLEIDHDDAEGYDIEYIADLKSLTRFGIIEDTPIEPGFAAKALERIMSREPMEMDYEPIFVNIAPNDFHRLVTNILENARKHGFVDKSVFYKVDIRLSVDEARGMYRIDFWNNGHPFPKGVDKTRYGLHGERAGNNAGTGTGGFVVKSIVEHYGGDYDIIQEDGWPIVSIYLPIAFEIDGKELQGSLD